MLLALARQAASLAWRAASEVLPRPSLEAAVEARLAWTIRHAAARVPFWTRRLGPLPDARWARTADLLRTLPLTRREDLLRVAPEELVARGATRGRRGVDRTSGSTGPALRCVLDERDLAAAGTVWLRSYHHLGLRPRHARVTLRMPDPGSVAWPPAWRLRRLLGLPAPEIVSAELPLEAQVAALRRLRAQALLGSPSELARIARWLRARRATLDGLELIVAGGEPLHDDVRALLREALGVEPRRVYGSTEAGFVAWECAHGRYHQNADHVHCELLGDGPDGLARLVVTTLERRAMPLVRYVTGDLVVPPDGPCPCGSRWPLLGEVLGRDRGFLRLPSGRTVAEREVARALAPAGGSDGYRLVQRARDRVLVRGERGLLADEAGRARALAALRPLVGPAVELALEPVEDLGWGGLDKRPLVDCRLPA